MRDKDYLKRCLQLARNGGKAARPNPLVGAVIVHNDCIIGEGFHRQFGGPHAEVNAVNSVDDEDKKYLAESTIYVSLEPCCHFGNTPPCTNLIIENKIPRVCIAEIDPSQKVNSKGIKQLEDHGISVEIIPIENNHLLDEFKVYQFQKRPFVQIKFAKSKDNFLGTHDRQIWLSNDFSKVFTHKMRAYTDAILIGTNTAVIDNPSLTLREHPGTQPLRVVLDREGRIPLSHTLLSDNLPCLIITQRPRNHGKLHKEEVVLNFSDENFLNVLLEELYKRGIYHLTVEGGAQMHKSFLAQNLWDEALVISTPKLIGAGVKAPNINGTLKEKYKFGEDKIALIKNIVS